MLPLIIIISAIILFPLTFTKKGRTILGKLRIATVIKLFSNKGKGFIVNNILSGKVDDAGEIVELNHIFLSTSGVYLIKVINQEGEIIGTEDDEEWTQTLKNGVSKTFPNPIKYANERVEEFKKISKIDHDVYKFIVFAKGKVKNNNSSAITIRELVKALKSREKIEVFTKEEIAEYANVLAQNKERRINEFVANNKCYKCGAPITLIKKKNNYIIACSNKKCGAKVKL